MAKKTKRKQDKPRTIDNLDDLVPKLETEPTVSPELIKKAFGQLPEDTVRKDWRRLIGSFINLTVGHESDRDLLFELLRTKAPELTEEEIVEEWIREREYRSEDRDFLIKRLEKQGYRLLATQLRDALGAPTDERRVRIKLSTNSKEVNDRLVDALSWSDEVYACGPFLVKLCRDSAGELKPRPLCEYGLSEELSAVAELIDPEKGKPKAIQFPTARQILARSEWPGVKKLRTVVDFPALLPDGSLLDQEGHYPREGIYVSKPYRCKVKERPTKADATRAASELLAIVAEFPFESESDCSVWLAAVLTLLGRTAFEGPTPLFYFDANKSGSGKTLLCQTAIVIGLGSKANVALVPEDNEEMKKLLVSYMGSKAKAVLFDNNGNNSDFGFASLDAVITSGKFSDRLLGLNKRVEGEIEAVFFANGNQLVVSRKGDPLRRLAYCRLTSREEQPDQKPIQGPKDEELIRHLIAERPKLISAGLTLLRAFIQSGEDPGVKPRGSFSAWSKLIRGAIVWAGLPDPDESLQRFREVADPNTSDAAAVIAALRELRITESHNSKRPGHLLEELKPWAGGDFGSYRSDVLEIAFDVLTNSGKNADAAKVGYRLKDLTALPVGGWWIQGRKRSHTTEYWAEPVDADAKKEPEAAVEDLF